MKKIQLSLTDKAFAKIKQEIFCAALGQKDSNPYLAWKLVLDAIERGDNEKTIRTKEEVNH